jgi:plastocyanin
MTSRTAPRVLLAGVLTMLFAVAPNAAAATHAITIANFAFTPASATITAGDTVSWTNTDQAPHDVTVTSGPVAVHSPTITTGQSWTYTFTTPGTYAYICSIHPTMQATLVVAAVPAPTPTHAAVAPVPPVPARIAPARTAAPPAPASAAVAAPTTAVTSMPTPAVSPTGAVPAASAASSSGGQQTVLDPLLLVAGLVAGVATLCLLLIGSRPESHRD